MLSFLRRTKHDREDLVDEHWETSFSPLAKVLAFPFPEKRKKQYRFQEEETEKYAGVIRGGALALTLKKPNLFAWIKDAWYRYRDFSITAELEFDPGNGYSSTGVLLKQVNDDNFYYFLISNRGYFRFDVVFNGNPLSLVPWTFCGIPEETVFTLRIIVRANHFSFFLGDEWLAELESDTIESGGVCFAGQNYNEAETARVYLHRIEIESRPLRLETEHYRWNNYIPVDPQRRIRFARSLYSQGQYAVPAIQLKKAARQKHLDASDYVVLADSLMNLDMLDEALESMEKALEISPDLREAFIGKAEILYLLNRLLDCRDFLEKNRERIGESSVLWNILGNAEYGLGNWDKAYEAYKNAVALDPDMPLFSVNIARTLERLDRREEAFTCYLTAARLLFREEAYDDLAGLIPKIEELDNTNLEGKALHGKMLFHEGAFERAEELFLELCETAYSDSAVFFLLGVLFARRGERRKADHYVRKAIELEPNFGLYWFRLAENRYLMGEKLVENGPGENMPADNPLKKALEFSPDDPWVANLAGLCYLDEGDPQKAVEFFKKAVDARCEEQDILLNYAHALYRAGKKEEAFLLLKDQEGYATAYNLFGNLLSEEGLYEDAVAYYEKALELEPENPVFLENCGAANIELNLINRAEERITKAAELLDAREDRAGAAGVYNLIGNIARIKGEAERARLAYIECLRRDPDHREGRINLSDFHYAKAEYEKAKELLEQIPQRPSGSKEEQLYKKVMDKLEVTVVCAECGRKWVVERAIGPQPQVRLYGEPPGGAPAGECSACGRVYCIDCASKWVKDKRFYCPHCNEFLSLENDHLRYLLLSYVEER
jgi:tetratricopeptide (TPR) repeat protein